VCGAFEEQGVDERLREVASHLALGHVVLFREQPGRAAGGAVAFEPAQCRGKVALLMGGQCDEEPAEKEGAFGASQGPVVVAEPVGVSVAGEFGGVGPQRVLG
jgi:hypothetical protein